MLTYWALGNKLMPSYKIQKKIKTLSDNYADIYKNSFNVDGLCFKQWDYNAADGCLGDAWLVEFEIEANSLADAYGIFSEKLQKIIPRISLICQTYIHSNQESFLITRNDKNFGFIYYVQEELPVGLMFMEEHKKALDLLLGDGIKDEFFYYWNDAVNTIGYTAKILLMTSAIEALIKKPNGDKDYDLRKQILGTDLDDKLFVRNTGLRHRLVHGEYLSHPEDSGTNYVIQIHKKIITYFNKEVFKEDLLSESVVGPQRNFIDNHSIGKFYIKPLDSAGLDLKSILNAYVISKENGTGLNLSEYDYIHGSETEYF